MLVLLKKIISLPSTAAWFVLNAIRRHQFGYRECPHCRKFWNENTKFVLVPIGPNFGFTITVCKSCFRKLTTEEIMEYFNPQVLTAKTPFFGCGLNRTDAVLHEALVCQSIRFLKREIKEEPFRSDYWPQPGP